MTTHKGHDAGRRHEQCIACQQEVGPGYDAQTDTYTDYTNDGQVVGQTWMEREPDPDDESVARGLEDDFERDMAARYEDSLQPPNAKAEQTAIRVAGLVMIKRQEVDGDLRAFGGWVANFTRALSQGHMGEELANHMIQVVASAQILERSVARVRELEAVADALANLNGKEVV